MAGMMMMMIGQNLQLLRIHFGHQGAPVPGGAPDIHGSGFVPMLDPPRFGDVAAGHQWASEAWKLTIFHRDGD